MFSSHTNLWFLFFHFLVITSSSTLHIPPSVVVVGAGPVGLGFAISLGKLLHQPITVLEAGDDVGEYVRSWHDWTNPVSNASELAILHLPTPECTTSMLGANNVLYKTCNRTQYVAYLSRVAKEAEHNGTILVHRQARVIHITKGSDNYHNVHVDDGRIFRAKYVVLATGWYSTPRPIKAQITRQGSARVLRSMDLRKAMLGSDSRLKLKPNNALVVGSGVSAVEITLGLLADKLFEKVILCFRGSFLKSNDNFPSTIQINALTNHMKSGELVLRSSTNLVSFNATHAVVVYQNLSTPFPHVQNNITLLVDVIISAIGYSPNASFFVDVAGVNVWPSSHSMFAGGPILQRGRPNNISVLVDAYWDQWGETSVNNIYALLTDIKGKNYKHTKVQFEDCDLIRSVSTHEIIHSRYGLVAMLIKQMCNDERENKNKNKNKQERENRANEYNCPHLTAPSRLIFPPSDMPTVVCFDVSNLLAQHEVDVLTFECMFSNKTNNNITNIPNDKDRMLYHTQKVDVSAGDPKLECIMPANSLPTVSFLVVFRSVALNQNEIEISESFEHWILSGIDKNLEDLLTGKTQPLKPLKLNLGSGKSLLNAAKGWVNLDNLEDTTSIFEAGVVTDRASVNFQSDQYTYAQKGHHGKNHLIRWDANSGFGFLPDNSVDIITTNCMLGNMVLSDHVKSIGPKEHQQVDVFIKEIHRVLKPGGVIRISDRYGRESVKSELRTAVINSMFKEFGDYRNVGPLITYTGDEESMHLLHRNCVACMRRHFTGGKWWDLKMRPDWYSNSKEFDEGMFNSGCWICHINIDHMKDESLLLECEKNNFKGEGCEKVGRLWGEPSYFPWFWAAEAVKSTTNAKNEDVFALKERNGFMLNYSNFWPCFKGETQFECRSKLFG